MNFFTELFELYEKEFYSDLLALTNIAKRISNNKEISINFNQSSYLAFTDGKFIYLPSKLKNEIKHSQGLVAHESGHIGYGSYELSFIKLVDTLSDKYELPKFLVKQAINVIEDVRINSLNKIKFPGFYNSLRSYTAQLMPKIILRMKKSGDLLTYINLFMEDYVEFQKKPKFRTEIMSDDDWSIITLAKKFLLKSLTPTSSIITCDQICKILRKYYRKKKLQQENPTNLPQAYNSHEVCENRPNSKDGTYDNQAQEFLENYNERINPENDGDLDSLEDPSYCDESEQINNRKMPYNQNELIINHFEDFSNDKRQREKTDLDTNSERTIEKIKNANLNKKDLELLTEELGTINNQDNEINDSGKMDLENLSQFDSVDLSEKTEKKENKILNYSNRRFRNDEMPSISIEDLTKEGDLIQRNDLEDFIKLVQEAQDALEDRLIILDQGDKFIKLEKGGQKRKVTERHIKNETMSAITLTYNQITQNYKNLITKIKFIFRDFKNQADMDTFQKRGRINNKFIKAITSEFKYDKCFTKKIKKKELKILLMVDISGSMRGQKLESAKIAMIMLCEALHKLAKLRIILFTGEYNALNILLKDFDENPNPKHFDKFGCHSRINSNLDGVSLKHEAFKLEKNVIIIIISDGQPAGSGGYGLYDAINEIQEVQKIYKVFAFSIDANGDYLNKLYGRNWILTKSSDKIDLGDKLIKFCKLVVKEYLR